MLRPCVTISILSTLGTALTLSLPSGSGPYGSSLSITNLTDSSRIDPYSPTGHPRNLMVSIFGPAAPLNECHNATDPYMPYLSAAFYDQIYAPYTTNGSFESLSLPVCTHATPATYPLQHRCKPPSALPLVIFSPGSGNSRLIYSAVAQCLSSHGLHVLTIDHPYDALDIEYPDGSYVLAANISTDQQYEEAIGVRVQDVKFVLDSLTGSSASPALLPRHSVDLGKVFVIGHSLGGATALSAMLSEERIRAGVNMDGKFFPGVLPANITLKRPFMLMGNEARNASTDSTWELVSEQYLKGPKVEVQIEGFEHGAFTDLPLLLKSFGSDGYVEGVGSVDGERAVEVVTGVLVAFLQAVMGEKGCPKLKDVVEEFPEVKIIEM